MTDYDIDTWIKYPAKPTTKVQPKWLREHWIAHLVQTNNWTRGCELGVWRGRTFLHLLQHCPRLTLIGVDVWAPQPGNDGPEDYVDTNRWPHQQNEQTVRQGAKKFGKRAIIYKMWTHEAAALVENDSLDFVFVDADHGTEAVRNDITTWLPKVKDTGWIIGHDINWPTVKVVANELLPGYVIGPDNAWGRAKCV